MQESYNKRQNILFHGVEEDQTCAWETHEKTLEKLEYFLTSALKVDSGDINVVDSHRLPQTPLRIQDKNVYRPIIVKLDSAMEKSLIFSKLQHLKSYNISRRMNHKPNIFVTVTCLNLFLNKKSC